MEFLTASFQVIFEKIIDFTIGVVGRQIRYPIDYKKNTDNLGTQVKEIEDARDDVECKVEVARRNEEQIEGKVRRWLTDVEEITAKVGKFFEDDGQAKMKCCNGQCPNLKARYKLSKRAYKLGLEVKEIMGKGNFTTVGHRVSIEGIGIEGYEDFESRRSIFEGVMKALKDDNIRAIGVYGMGGTGKTMLVGKVARQAMEEKLFEEVVTIVVSQTPNLKKIQEDIAKELDLIFKNEETDFKKAHLLHERLNQGKKILIIVDDIWKKLDLEALGISFEDDKKGCKILLTSRSKDVLVKDMDAQEIIPVGVLLDNEATYLFRKIVGDSVETLDFQSIVDEVIEECGGLPIALTAVAHALKSETAQNVWKDALRQLRMANPIDIEGMHEKVYRSIKLSYNVLSKEAQSLFLFCSTFQEDVDIPIEFLWRLLVGLDFFQDVFTMEELRSNVYKLVGKLKASCLLLEGEKSGTVKMHGVIRDVSIYIADKDKQMLTIRSSDNLKKLMNPKVLEDSILMALYDFDSSELPERLECPQVKLIILERQRDALQIQNTFFEGVNNLKVLVLRGVCLTKLPSSLLLLDNLQTLYLIGCKLENIAMIGELKNLNALSLSGSNIRQLPKEIEQLTDLKLLDLTNCSKLEVIPPNVLSNLKKLEELYMKRSFDEWEIEEQGMERRNARISDLDHLSNLTTLQIKIPNVKILSKFLFLEKLERYEILIGWNWGSDSEDEPEILRKLKLCLDRSFQLEVGIKKILKSCECLYLGEMEGVDCIPDEDFPKLLKYLYIGGNDEIQYIISWTGLPRVAFPLLESISLERMIKLEKICHGQLAEGSFGNLTKLKVYGCHSLRFMFSSSVVGYFSKLQEIDISSCTGMSAIVAKESEEEIEINDITTNTMEFPQLRCLRIESLPSLMGFYSGVDSHLLFNEKICHGQLAEGSFGNLTKLEVYCCDSLRFMFSSSVVGYFSKLQEIDIQYCHGMSAIVAKESEEEIEINDITTNTMEFPQLRCIRIWDLPSLMGFYSGEIKVVFPKLEEIYISSIDNLIMIWNNQFVPHSFCKLQNLVVHNCGNLKKVIPHNILRTLQNLNKLEILDCSSVEEVFEIRAINIEETTHLVASRLRYLKLYNLPNLNYVWSSDPQAIHTFQNLCGVDINGCIRLKSVFPISVSKDLAQLGSLCIKNCGVEELVAMEEGSETTIEFVLPRLTCLSLQDLPELKCFYPRKHTLLWSSSLKRLEIYRCPKVKIISSDDLSCQDYQQALFPIEKVGFPELEEIDIRGINNLIMFPRNQIVPHSFCKLQNLFAHNCGNLKKVFPHNMLRTLQNLNKLEILDCASVEEIFEISGVYIEEITTHMVESMLRDLKLYNLPNLNHVWSSDPQEILTFENLLEVDIDGCISLKSVFPMSVAKNLAQLQFLCIKNCAVEEIVAMEEESETTIEFVLPKVTCLILRDLPELKCFYPRKHTLLWPSLKRLEIYRCPKVKIVSLDDLSWQDTNRLGLNYFPIQQPLFPIEKVAFPNLEIIEISNLKEINQLVSNSIHKLQKFIVEDCESLRNIFPPNRLRRLQNLKELKILSCTSVEVVFEIRGVNVKETIDMVASNGMLRDLKLYNLPNLKHVWSSDPFEVLLFDDLREVEVDSCKSLKSLFPVSVAKNLVRLERLHIKNCGVEEIVALEEGSETAIEFVFPQVTILILEDLPELKCFYPRKHALKWPSLKTLKINKCPWLKIFTLADLSFQDKNGPGHHHVRIQHPLMLTIEDGFHSLRMERIHKKDHLNIIWHNKDVTNYFCRPKTLSVEWCDRLINIFDRDMLRRLQILEKLEIFGCNSTTKVFAIQRANVKEISFQLKCLYLYNLPKLQYVWSLYQEVNLTFQNLHDVKVSNCESLRSIFPVSVAKQLLQLEMLEVCDCGVEEIVGKEGGLNSGDTFIFPKLRSLRLERLPKLKSFYGGEHISKWALLKDLNICDCDKLKSFGSDVLSFEETSGLYHPTQQTFPVFLIQKDTFPNLEGLKFGWKDIKNQTHSRFPAQFFSRLKVLELSGAIFEELCVLISEEEQYAWTLERLTVLKLTKMPRLTHLLKENPQTTMALQNLEKLAVSQCDTLKKLVPSSMSFHNLRKLEVSQCRRLICLLNPSTAKSLVRLTKMIIFECERMTAIVANEGDEAGDEIIFSELKSLKLHCLHNLISFHSGNCTIKFPTLKESFITECPNLKTSLGVFSMPKLKSFKQAEKAETVPQTRELWDGDLVTTIKRFSVDELFTEKTKVQTTAQSNTPPPTKVEQIASAEEEELNDDYDLEYSAATRPSKGKQRVIDEATQNPSFNPVVAIDEPMPNATILFRQEDIISQVTDEGIPAQVEEDIVKVEPSMGFPEEDHSFTDLVEFRRTKFNATNPITAEFIAAELVLFMEKFDKEEYNGQPPEHFWIWTGSFDDFIQFKVPSEGLPLLIQLKERYGDFMAGFQFGATTGSFMLSMLCAILLDMQNSFVGNIDEVRLLEWRGVVRELMKAGFAVGFILDHLRDMARAVFNQRAKGVIENLNTQIVDLKKTFTELEFRRDQLVAGGLAPTIPSAYSRISDGLLN